MTDSGVLIGVDVGGTFTDLLAYDGASGTLHAAKVPSLPGAQWQGVLDALFELGIATDDIRAIVHGTTISTNALLERKGARTALLTTSGFRDLVEIGKGRRLIGGLFDVDWQRPPALVARRLRFEIQERIGADAAVVHPLARQSVAAAADQLQAERVEAVAVAFVNAYANPQHEDAAAEILARLAPELPVSRSAALCAERGEFERTSTCVLNAYLTPNLRAYLNTLSRALNDAQVTAPVSIMGSNGGAMPLERAASRAAGTFLSGPVGGVVGALQVASAAGVRDIITFDMGGTSTDVALVRDLSPRMSHDNQIDAYPLKLPQLDIHTIGAGGGSIIDLRADGTLGIGPESAGAVPGPACYGRGGERATISDANLILGRLPTDKALSGGLKMDMAAARRALSALAQRLDHSGELETLAEAAVRIAVSRMAGAVREVSVHRGFDPREFALFGFGGAGPMHVFLVAEELEIPLVLIPPLPGHLSALGQLAADVRRDLVEAWGGPVSKLDADDLRRRIEALEARAAAALLRDGIDAQRHRMQVTLDMRYAGQSFTLEVPWLHTDGDLTPARRRFDSRHGDTFGYSNADAEAELVNVRVVAIGEVDKPNLAALEPEVDGQAPDHRPVWFDDWVSTPVWHRGAIVPGNVLHGPLIVEEAGGTTVVPPKWSVETLPGGTLRCELPA